MWPPELSFLGEVLSISALLLVYFYGLSDSEIDAESQVSEAVNYYYSYPIVIASVGAFFAAENVSFAFMAVGLLLMVLCFCRSRGVFDALEQVPPYSHLILHVLAIFPVGSSLGSIAFSLGESHYWPMVGYITTCIILSYSAYLELYHRVDQRHT